MKKFLKLTLLLVATFLAFNGCCDKPQVLTKTVYIKAKCEKIADINYTLEEWSPLDINYSIEEIAP